VSFLVRMIALVVEDFADLLQIRDKSLQASQYDFAFQEQISDELA
jgi:hypothetical protein